MFVLNSFLCLCFSSCACRSFVAFQALCIAKNFKLGTVLHVGPTRFTPEQLNEELVGNNINVKFVCAYLVVNAVASKFGPFKNTVTKKDCISSKDPTQGYFYWWLMLHFFIQGVCKKKMTVPGLSLSRPGGEASECEKCVWMQIECLRRSRLDSATTLRISLSSIFSLAPSRCPNHKRRNKTKETTTERAPATAMAKNVAVQATKRPPKGQRGQENNDDTNEEEEDE